MRRRTVLLAGAALPFIRGLASAQPAGAGTVNVLYAGSLVNLMEHGVGPAFDTVHPRPVPRATRADRTSWRTKSRDGSARGTSSSAPIPA